MLIAGVVGVGYWGPNIIRNLVANKKFTVKYCSDLKSQRMDHITSLYPTVKTTKDYKEIINDPKIDVVAICTPVFSHFEIAVAALKAGKHILIEKPMTSTTAQAEELINLAEQKNLTILVDHTFLFTGAVQKIKELVDSGDIGDIYYFDSVRVNLGLFQHDVNVVWDLAPHDISIMDHIIGRSAESIAATGSDHVGNGLEDVAYVTVFYPDNIIAHIHVNWLSPVKIRQTQISGTRKMIVWDDNSPSEKIKIYDKGIEVVQTTDQIYNTLIQYRTGDMYCPKIPQTEALAVELDHFAACLESGTKPISDGYSGLRVVQILESSEKSIKNRGKEIRL
ncbi:MAG: Gfo/Idh/MocA family oxidoreductase [bacterium]|nr:MAG: Gfo/Idh/MocA family oxidoreductase [bacterium]